MLDSCVAGGGHHFKGVHLGHRDHHRGHARVRGEQQESYSIHCSIEAPISGRNLRRGGEELLQPVQRSHDPGRGGTREDKRAMAPAQLSLLHLPTIPARSGAALRLNAHQVAATCTALPVVMVLPLCRYIVMEDTHLSDNNYGLTVIICTVRAGASSSTAPN